MIIKCLVVEDEPLARDVLINYVDDIDWLDIVATNKDGIEAINTLQTEGIDLIFLDINMPRLSGINLIKALDNPPLVIFTTAYPDYAVEGFELEAIDYLVKPFSFERFLKAVNRARTKIIKPINQDFIMLKADKRNHKVNYDDILHFESIGDYVKVFLKDERVLIISETLKQLEDLLPSSFIRIHKSHMIAIDQIEYLEGNQVRVSDKMLSIGKSYRKAVSDQLKSGG